VFLNESSTSPSNPFWGPPGFTNYAGDTITAGDTDSSSQGYVTIPSAIGLPHSFLAAVQFFVPGGGTLPDQFTISLLTPTTEFDDLNGNAITDFTVQGGVVTIAAAVPEPSSLAMMSLSGLSGLFWYWRRQRERQKQSSTGNSARTV
jgi:PEP-CTERM motif-containing protein